MSNGDPILAGKLNTEEKATILIGSPGGFPDATFFRAGEPPSQTAATGRVDGIHGFGAAPEKSLDGGSGMVGFGAIPKGTGVVGIGGTLAGLGVLGVGGNMHTVSDNGPIFPAGAGLVGVARASQSGTNFTSPAVIGYADANDGVVGYARVSDRSGVYGYNDEKLLAAYGVYGRTNSKQGTGVAGSNDDGQFGVGISGRSRFIGVIGAAPTAGLFVGNVVITGDSTCLGVKSAAVPFGDGTLRRLYSMESPESWFEDFGEAALTRGKAVVEIAADFQRCVRRGTLHVFLTPLGDCNGLYVRRKSASVFEVRELRGGKSSLRFSYRVIAKRKDIEGKRLEKVTLPAPPAPTSVKEVKKTQARDAQLQSLAKAAVKLVPSSRPKRGGVK